ncbi:MAG: TetR/AcrR family transcriptional regulator [Bacteroidota bacterium]
MKKTKKSILDTSRKLFNDLGYSNITIRMIAMELNMSSGNLNYHFRKREDILEALYFEMVEVFDARVEEVNDQAISLAYMQANIEASMGRMIEYRFFWTDLYFLLKSNQKIRTHFEKAKMERKAGYRFVFDALRNANILKEPSFEQEYSTLIDRMIDYSNTWLYAALLYEVKKNNVDVTKDFSFRLLSMLYPYLTEEAQQDFRAIFPTFF